MTVSKDLMLSILSMDACNRGYGAGIAELGGEGPQIGSATIGRDAEQLLLCGSVKRLRFGPQPNARKLAEV